MESGLYREIRRCPLMLLCTEAVKKALRKIHQMVIGQQKILSISIQIYEKYSN